MSNTTQHLCKKVLSRREDSTNEVSAYLVFCALIIAGLCFGQGIEPAFDSDVSLMLSRSIYIKPSEQMNSLPMNEMAFNIAYHKPMLNAYTLLMQAEGESLQLKTPFWKQAGIYGLEFVGAGIGTALPSYYSLIIIATNFMDNPQDSAALKLTLCFYAIGNILLGSSSTWATGKILGQAGSWWKSAIGSGIGSVLGALAYHKPGCDDWRLISIFLIAPPLGAVVGYNW